MTFEEHTLDDLLFKVYSELLVQTTPITASRGTFREILGCTLCLQNPRARLSKSEGRGKITSALGEFLWYFTKSNELAFIEHYIPEYKKESEDNLTVNGGYGKRMFKYGWSESDPIDQISTVLRLLKEKPTSRRAVIQLFSAVDLIVPTKNVPCTCTLQFLIRDRQLHMFVSMRSNDAYLGLPHDVFCFTLLQEVLAQELEVSLGQYNHYVSSLHLYANRVESAKKYLDEGLQSTLQPMPKMVDTSPLKSISDLLRIEEQMRTNNNLDPKFETLEHYWRDPARVLYVHSLLKNEQLVLAKNVVDHVDNANINRYITDRIEKYV